MDDEFYEDDFEDEEVLENAVLCPTCEDVTSHQILREKEAGRRGREEDDQGGGGLQESQTRRA